MSSNQYRRVKIVKTIDVMASTLTKEMKAFGSMNNDSDGMKISHGILSSLSNFKSLNMKMLALAIMLRNHIYSILENNSKAREITMKMISEPSKNVEGHVFIDILNEFLKDEYIKMIVEDATSKDEEQIKKMKTSIKMQVCRYLRKLLREIKQ